MTVIKSYDQRGRDMLAEPSLTSDLCNVHKAHVIRGLLCVFESVKIPHSEGVAHL